MGVYDAAIITTDGVNVVATVQRNSGGPLENGYFDVNSVWQPSGGPNFVGGVCFGIDASNNQPYFDTAGATVGEAADFWVDPVAGLLWLGGQE